MNSVGPQGRLGLYDACLLSSDQRWPAAGSASRSLGRVDLCQQAVCVGFISEGEYCEATVVKPSAEIGFADHARERLTERTQPLINDLTSVGAAGLL